MWNQAYTASAKCKIKSNLALELSILGSEDIHSHRNKGKETKNV